MSRLAVGFGVLLLVAALVPSAKAQAVAFEPIVNSFPNGATLSAVPVVSADRRYVRLTLNPQFTALTGFDTFQVPAAVSGGPGGALPGGLAGLNGPTMGGAALPAPSADAPPARVAALTVAGGRSESDPFQNALVQYSDGPRAAAAPDSAPRSAKGTAPKKGARRREIIRKRP